MIDLNKKIHKIKCENMFNNLFSGHRFIHDGGMPMNEVYWHWVKVVDDKCINMVNLRYLDYVDLVNENIRPFKKD